MHFLLPPKQKISILLQKQGLYESYKQTSDAKIFLCVILCTLKEILSASGWIYSGGSGYFSMLFWEGQVRFWLSKRSDPIFLSMGYESGWTQPKSATLVVATFLHLFPGLQLFDILRS